MQIIDKYLCHAFMCIIGNEITTREMYTARMHTLFKYKSIKIKYIYFE